MGQHPKHFKPSPGFQPQEKKRTLEELITQFFTKSETKFQNQDVIIRNMERQIGQLASMILERPQGSLPSNTETNPKEKVQTITLRSDKELKNSKRETSKK